MNEKNMDIINNQTLNNRELFLNESVTEKSMLRLIMDCKMVDGKRNVSNIRRYRSQRPCQNAYIFKRK